MSAKQHHYDVIIVGGGPVGLTMAAVLVRFCSGIKVALCDKRPFSVPNDPRASAIAAGITRVFEGLGLWEQMARSAAPINEMKITDSGTGDMARPLFLAFSGDVVPGRPYAHMVPNKTILTELLAAVQDKVDLFGSVEITQLDANANVSKISFADGAELTAELVIAADGGNSLLRSLAGIEVIGHDYGQMGIVTTIAHELDHQNTAYEHFRPSGPFASLPLPDRRSSLVWTVSTKEAETYMAMEPEALAPLIEQEMGSVLGSVRIEGKVQAFPLKLQIARDCISKRLALIGDAAHIVHPISGQGLNLGIHDVAALAEVVIEAIRLGEDHGAENVLERYQQWRRFDVAAMAAATDSLNRLFSNDIAPLRAIRDLGMGLVDRLPPLKSGLIRHAAGLSSGPRLTKGQAI